MKATTASILIVDDDAANRDLLNCFLSSGYQCVTAESAERALELLEDRRFSVVITDLNMPGESGFELCHMVKQKWPRTAVVIVSGVNDSSCFNQAHRVGAIEYLTKPIDLVWLSQAIKHALQSEER